MSKILKLLKFLMLIIFVTSHNLPEYMEHGFICPDTEDMEPTSSGSFQKGNNPFSVQVWLPNGRKCYFNWETLARIVVSHPWRKIMGFSIQARKGPDFRRRIGMMLKITDATTHCDELGAITHKSYQPRSEVQVQWARLGAELTDKLMFRVITVGEEKWYSVNITLENCHLINECSSSPCKNNGTCLDGLAFYACECPPGFTGYNCEKDIDECENNYCKNNATCKNTIGSYTCICSHGWKGKNCDQNVDECKTDDPCSDHGICHDLPGGYKCVCLPGWTGRHCDIDIDECKQNPCRPNGNCTNTDGSYVCNCNSGWKGWNCTERMFCDQNPCKNGGTCNEDQMRCTCRSAWTGEICEVMKGSCGAKVEEHVDFYLHDINLVALPATALMECCELCKKTKQCIAFTAILSLSFCYLKTSTEGWTWHPEAASGLMPSLGTCGYVPNSRYAGLPYHKESDVKTKETCCFICIAEKRCNTFVWEWQDCKLYESASGVLEEHNAVVGLLHN